MAGYTFKSEEDVRRIIRAVLATERRPLPPIRPTQHLFSPLGATLPTVPCLNSSGFVIPPYGLVKVSGSQNAEVACVRPNAVWGTYLVNGPSEVPVDGSFRAHAAGLVTFATSAPTAGPGYYGPTANSFLCQAGVLIDHFVGGQGNLDPPDVLWGKPLANIAQGAAGSMILYLPGLTAISPQITVPIARTFAALDSTKFMSAVHNGGAWYGLPAEC